VAFFLGIDGGGTKTRCLLGDENSVLGTGTSSSCKVQRVGEACAHDALAAAIHEACVQAGISPRQITRTCAGITGAGRLEIANVMQDLLSSIVGGEIEIIGDVEVGFEDAFGSGPGVIVIAGTGSIAYGRNSRGKTARAGGWGHAISDEGSGYWIGVEAVKAALHESDGQGHSDLLNSAMGAVGAKSFDDFIVRVNEDSQPDYAALFPTVLAAADLGNSIASAVLNQAGIELAKLAGTVLKGIHADSDEISLASHGGAIANSSIVMKSFARELRLQFPRIRLTDQPIDASRGGLKRARRLHGSA
jgi:N-acetylglucosamine kinase-like BadF-type ATPase